MWFLSFFLDGNGGEYSPLDFITLTFFTWKYNHWKFLQVMDFVSRYLPAYHAYLPTLYRDGPNGSKPEHLLVIDIDEGRNPLWGN